MKRLIALVALAACTQPPPRYSSVATPIPWVSDRIRDSKPLAIRDITVHVAAPGLASHTRFCDLVVKRGGESRSFRFDGWPDQPSGSLLGPDNCPGIDAHEGDDTIVITRESDGLALFAFRISTLSETWRAD